MKIAIVADKKAGHLSQCLGLIEKLFKNIKGKGCIYSWKDLFFLPGFVERTITIFSEKLYLFVLKLMNPSVVDFKYDFVFIFWLKNCYSSLSIGQIIWG